MQYLHCDPASVATRLELIGIMEMSSLSHDLSFLLCQQRKKAYKVDNCDSCNGFAALEQRKDGRLACMRLKEDQRVEDREETESECKNMEEADGQESDILEEIEIEDFAVDGICGVY